MIWSTSFYVKITVANFWSVAKALISFLFPICVPFLMWFSKHDDCTEKNNVLILLIGEVEDFLVPNINRIMLDTCCFGLTNGEMFLMVISQFCIA